MHIRLCLLAALLALPLTGAIGASPPTDAALTQVNDILATIDLANPRTFDAAEEVLVNGGVQRGWGLSASEAIAEMAKMAKARQVILPAIQAVLVQKQAALTAAEAGDDQQRQLGNVPLLQMQIDVLDRAVIRLTWKIAPPQLIQIWYFRATTHLAVVTGLSRPMRIMDPRVAGVFPTVLFYVVRFRQFPVARRILPPLMANNVFAVNKEGDVLQLTDTPGLKAYFQANLDLAAADADTKELVDVTVKMKDAMYSWLRIAQEFVQDGMMSFTIPEKALPAEMATVGMQPAKWIVNGEADVVANAGNTGSLKATMWFDRKTWKLLDVQQTNSVKAGIRPICQATKLLDPDLIVRRMAEQDLLFMGAAAENYIMEQRAKASPALQAAIDRIWAQIFILQRP